MLTGTRTTGHRFAACSFVLLLGVIGSLAQETPCIRKTIIASVLNEYGLPVSSLTADNFRAEFRGKPVKILSAASDTRPRRIAVVLDASETMRDVRSGKWPLAKEIAAHIIQNGPRGSIPSFAVFGSATGPPVRPPAGERERMARPQKLEDLMHGLPIIGRGERRPPLFDVMSQAMAMLVKPELGDVIFLVTDGGEEASKTKPEGLQRELIGAGIRLFAVTLPMRYDLELSVVRQFSSDKPYDEQAESTDFLNTVQFSGGKCLRVRSKHYANEWGFHFSQEERLALATALQVMYLQMAQFYRVEIELPQAVEKTSGWKLDLVPPAGVAKKSLRLIYQKKLVSCSLP